MTTSPMAGELAVSVPTAPSRLPRCNRRIRHGSLTGQYLPLVGNLLAGVVHIIKCSGVAIRKAVPIVNPLPLPSANNLVHWA